MKTVLCVLLLLIAQTWCLDDVDKYFNDKDFKCMKEAGIEKDDLVKSFDVATFTFPETDILKSYMDCWQRESKLINKDAQIVPESWILWLTSVFFPYMEKPHYPHRFEVATTAVNNCLGVKAEKSTDKAMKIWNCILPQLKTLK